MGESATHKKLVRIIKFWIEESYQGYDLTFLWIDNLSEEGYGNPKRIDSYIPDLYARSRSKNLEIIGEAKTANDIENIHTEEQILAFLRYCALCQNSILVLGVPWDYARCMQSLVKYLKKSSNTDKVVTFIVDNLRKLNGSNSI